MFGVIFLPEMEVKKMSKKAIVVKNLTKKYGSKIAINDLSFEVENGKVFGLLGSNGAGKSSTVECILGTKKKDSGEIKLLGMDPIRDRKKVFEQVGVQFQETKYQDLIKVSELCETTSAMYGDSKNYEELLEQFGLADKKRNYVKDLSGGERQRLFIVLALLPNPKVLLMDELTTGLDTKVRRDIWKCLLSLKKKGLSILLTSHFMDEVEILCDEILILKKGKEVFRGTVEEAKEKSEKNNLEDAYLYFAEEDEK